MSTTDIKQLTDDQALRALYSAKAKNKELPDDCTGVPGADEIIAEYVALWHECNRRGLLG